MAYMTKWWLKSNVEKEMPHSPVKVEISEYFSSNLYIDIRDYQKIDDDDISLTLKLEHEEEGYEWVPETEKGYIETTELKYLKIYFTQSDVEELIGILNSKINLD